LIHDRQAEQGDDQHDDHVRRSEREGCEPAAFARAQENEARDRTRENRHAEREERYGDFRKFGRQLIVARKYDARDSEQDDEHRNDRRPPQRHASIHLFRGAFEPERDDDRERG
jgi:hypothetical protein